MYNIYGEIDTYFLSKRVITFTLISLEIKNRMDLNRKPDN